MYSDRQPAQTDPRQTGVFKMDETSIWAKESNDLPADTPAPNASYYGLPPVKHSQYRWKTALSFLSEALGGAPQVIAAVIHFSGNPDARKLVRVGRYLALASSFASPALLISELHTPGRWFNMLRIFRSTSPMSVGNMSLTAFGIFSFLTAAGQLLEDLGHPSGRTAGAIFCLPAAAAGGMICLYPGTELEKTCTPLWADSSPLLSPLFAATGLSAGAAALDIAAQRLAVPEKGRDLLNRFSLMALCVQLTAALLMEKVWRDHGGVRSFKHSRYAPLYRFGVVGPGVVFPLVMRLIQVLTGRPLPAGRSAASAATIAGGFMLFNVALEAGNVSADNPIDYLDYTRTEQMPQKEKPSADRLFNKKGAIGLSLLAAAGMYLLWKRRPL